MSTPPKSQPAPKFDRERVARILVEADSIGNDLKAAKQLGISDRSIRNYRKRRDSDPILAELFRKYSEEEAKQWRLARSRALLKACERGVELLEKEDDLDKVTRFIEKTGGTDLAAEALGVGSEHHQQRPAPGSHQEPAPGDDDADEAGEDSLEH